METKDFTKAELIEICNDILSSSELWGEFFEVAHFTTPWVITFQHKPIDGHIPDNSIIKIDIRDQNKTQICLDLPSSWDVSEVVLSRKARVYCDLFDNTVNYWEDSKGQGWKSPYTKTLYLLNKIRKLRGNYNNYSLSNIKSR